MKRTLFSLLTVLLVQDSTLIYAETDDSYFDKARTNNTWTEWAICQGSQTFESCASVFNAMDVRKPVWHWKNFQITFSRDGTNTAAYINKITGNSGTLHLELVEGHHILKDSCIVSECNSTNQLYSNVSARVSNAAGHFVTYVKLYKSQVVDGQNIETICVHPDYWRKLRSMYTHRSNDFCTVKYF